MNGTRRFPLHGARWMIKRSRVIGMLLALSYGVALAD